MATFGVILAIAGAAGMLLSFAMNVSVEGTTIANLDLMNQRLMVAIVSSAAFVAGAIFTVGATLSTKLSSVSTASHPVTQHGGAQSAGGDGTSGSATSAAAGPLAAVPNGIEVTADGKYRVGNRVFEKQSDAEDMLDLIRRVNKGKST